MVRSTISSWTSWKTLDVDAGVVEVTRRPPHRATVASVQAWTGRVGDVGGHGDMTVGSPTSRAVSFTFSRAMSTAVTRAPSSANRITDAAHAERRRRR